MLDARRGEVYALAKDIRSGETQLPAAAIVAEDIEARLLNAALPFHLIGAAAPIVARALGEREVEVVATPEAPDIEDVARLGLAAAEGSFPPTPFYARDADAKPQRHKAVARQ